jgi:hypothetical protein
MTPLTIEFALERVQYSLRIELTLKGSCFRQRPKGDQLVFREHQLIIYKLFRTMVTHLLEFGTRKYIPVYYQPP